jgi:hypothetical protein
LIEDDKQAADNSQISLEDEEEHKELIAPTS